MGGIETALDKLPEGAEPVTALNDVMPLILFNIGLISLLSQVILLRELAVPFYGVELIYLFALGAWLFFTAAGAMFNRYLIATAGAGTMAAALLCLAVLLPLEILFIRASRLIFSGVPGAYLPFYQQLLVPMLAFFPMGFLAGFLFPPPPPRFISA